MQMPPKKDYRRCAICILGLSTQRALKGDIMTTKRLFFWGTIIAGAAAAYMMYRRGEPVGAIAVRTVTNPVGTLVSELEAAAG